MTTVTTRMTETSLGVTVRNDPSAVPPDPDHASSPDHGGQGLRGMRERVALLGGRLSTRPTAHGGYVVDASLPTAPQVP
jgi:signal transduction histidine kinase